jgi:hypothetical protein
MQLRASRAPSREGALDETPESCRTTPSHAKSWAGRGKDGQPAPFSARSGAAPRREDAEEEDAEEEDAEESHNHETEAAVAELAAPSSVGCQQRAYV